jgi:mRNA interferase HigB
MEQRNVLHVISRKKLLEAASQHGGLSAPLDAWYRAVKRASWEDIVEVRRQFPSADAAGKYTIFNININININIKGNAYRLITESYYRSQVVLVRGVMTHAEYEKEGWRQ